LWALRDSEMEPQCQVLWSTLRYTLYGVSCKLPPKPAISSSREVYLGYSNTTVALSAIPGAKSILRTQCTGIFGKRATHNIIHSMADPHIHNSNGVKRTGSPDEAGNKFIIALMPRPSTPCSIPSYARETENRRVIKTPEKNE